jgi:alpha,alpha-trehalase
MPFGSAEDPPDEATVCGVGNRKNERFLVLLAKGGLEAYQSTLDLIERLRAAGVAVALITSSRNSAAVLSSAGVDESLFDAIVDGNECSRLNLPGKPDPAVFLEAVRRLDVEPSDAVVVEDAVAGVEAGKAGGFGGVIGVDRSGSAFVVKKTGADVGVEDLDNIVAR